MAGRPPPEPEDVDAEELLELLGEACARLKVFPLPGFALFPGTPAPLHVFESRYRVMTAAALAGDRMLAMATLPDAARQLEAQPPLLPIAGAGFIEADELREDGRYDIAVRGLARVRLVEELPLAAGGYREFRAELAEDVYPPEGPESLRPAMQTLQQCVVQLVERLPEESGAPALAEAVTRVRSPGRLADLVAAAVVTEPDARYRALAELDVKKRLAEVTSEVAGVVLMLSNRGRGPSA